MTISNSDNIIDVRQIKERINELEDELKGADEDTGMNDDPWTDEREELKALEALYEDAMNASSDCTLINDDYFETYARELAADIYGVKDHWPFDHIDWKAAAEALQMDYSRVDFDGQSYWIRA